MKRINGVYLACTMMNWLWFSVGGCSGDQFEFPLFHETGSFTAPQAHQAAAADRRFVYAITNKVVAKYSRKTREQVAVSVGDAHHLNSGYIHRGSLLCAHSNYPQIPEQSQIKVLDPKSMQLTTFHDFGDYGGSLTWVVRVGNSWLCNFAKYDKNNGDTFLAEFDRNWTETRRWTYPQEMIAQLGKYSLSGGLFHQQRLLVTGHDAQEIYYLSIPQTGTVLKYVGKTPVPFTGQGFAVDPLGGLVGISRAEHRVIFLNEVNCCHLDLKRRR
ncbi:MAG: endonuclease [Planctomycetaceae bacterium]|jgi:hypothetical protein|nr:endonuclease [Planctomycetaceae bacterium]